MQLVLHITYISWIQHILFSINLKVTSFRVSFAAEYILSPTTNYCLNGKLGA